MCVCIKQFDSKPTPSFSVAVGWPVRQNNVIRAEATTLPEVQKTSRSRSAQRRMEAGGRAPRLAMAATRPATSDLTPILWSGSVQSGEGGTRRMEAGEGAPHLAMAATRPATSDLTPPPRSRSVQPRGVQYIDPDLVMAAARPATSGT